MIFKNPGKGSLQSQMYFHLPPLSGNTSVLRLWKGMLVKLSFLFSVSAGFAGTMIQVFFALAVASLGVLAYLIPDWRNLTTATSLPTIFLIGAFCVIATEGNK